MPICTLVASRVAVAVAAGPSCMRRVAWQLGVTEHPQKRSPTIQFRRMFMGREQDLQSGGPSCNWLCSLTSESGRTPGAKAALAAPT